MARVSLASRPLKGSETLDVSIYGAAHLPDNAKHWALLVAFDEKNSGSWKKFVYEAVMESGKLVGRHKKVEGYPDFKNVWNVEFMGTYDFKKLQLDLVEHDFNNQNVKIKVDNGQTYVQEYLMKSVKGETNFRQSPNFNKFQYLNGGLFSLRTLLAMVISIYYPVYSYTNGYTAGLLMSFVLNMALLNFILYYAISSVLFVFLGNFFNVSIYGLCCVVFLGITHYVNNVHISISSELSVMFPGFLGAFCDCGVDILVGFCFAYAINTMRRTAASNTIS